jgi:hypothetical protein
MSCFPAKVMATLLLFLLVGGIHIPPTSASLPYGNNFFFLKLLLYIYMNPFLIICQAHFSPAMIFLWPQRWSEELIAWWLDEDNARSEHY